MKMYRTFEPIQIHKGPFVSPRTFEPIQIHKSLTPSQKRKKEKKIPLEILHPTLETKPPHLLTLLLSQNPALVLSPPLSQPIMKPSHLIGSWKFELFNFSIGCNFCKKKKIKHWKELDIFAKTFGKWKFIPRGFFLLGGFFRQSVDCWKS